MLKRLRLIAYVRAMLAAAFVFTCVTVFLASATSVTAQVTAYRQAVAETAAKDAVLAEFYRSREFEGIWTEPGAESLARRQALFEAIKGAQDHGLPVSIYDEGAFLAELNAAQNAAERGRLEVELSKLFLAYARDVQTGLLVPIEVDNLIKRVVPLRDQFATLSDFAESNPSQFIRSLPPASHEYGRLMRQKFLLDQHIASGGWGPQVNATKLENGDSGPAVVALRNRLISMGFLARTASQVYDETMSGAVRKFQSAHGLEPDGTAGDATIAEINRSVEQRLQSVLVAMERERWVNQELGDRHIWVNLTDFSARIIDEGRISFETRSVIGANNPDRQSPEFSDVMEYMVINPSWYVPRSIITKEYLPQLQRNPNSVRHLEITNRRGQRIDRSAVDFTQFSARNFPFAMRQPPSNSNALGLVKFMFPNQYNIYLHDTPAKNLFSREVRAFSHGCIRLNDPFDFAYALLAKQTSDPEGFFQDRLKTGREARVNLDVSVPVHLVYRTAFTDAAGTMQYRRDIYGRDGRIWDALAREGVAVSDVQG